MTIRTNNALTELGYKYMATTRQGKYKDIVVIQYQKYVYNFTSKINLCFDTENNTIFCEASNLDEQGNTRKVYGLGYKLMKACVDTIELLKDEVFLHV